MIALMALILAFVSINQTAVSGGVNASYPINASNISQIINNNQSYWREFWGVQGTAVSGVWSWGNDAAQTDFSSVTTNSAGVWNTPTLNGEYKWSNVYLTPGIYNFSFITRTFSGGGIDEVLFGSTSLGTVDTYSAVSVHNVRVDFQLVLNSPTTADVRIKNSGKNASSSDHNVDFSRFWIEKTG